MNECYKLVIDTSCVRACVAWSVVPSPTHVYHIFPLITPFWGFGFYDILCRFNPLLFAHLVKNVVASISGKFRHPPWISIHLFSSMFSGVARTKLENVGRKVTTI